MSGIQVTERIAVVGTSPNVWTVSIDGKPTVILSTRRTALITARELAAIQKEERT